jgi:hypothetical protein
VIVTAAFVSLVEAFRWLPFLKESFDFKVRPALEGVAFLHIEVLALLRVQSLAGILLLDDYVLAFPLGLHIEALFDDERSGLWRLSVVVLLGR